MRIKVIHVIPGDKNGPVMIYAKRQTEALNKTGINGKTFYLNSRTNPGAVFSEFKRLKTEISNFNPHIIHAHYGTVTALMCATAAGKTPLIISFKGSDLNPEPGISGLRSLVGRFMSHLAAMKANRIICVSRELKQRLWIGKNKTEVITDGVNTDIFKPITREECIKELGLSQKNRHVLFNAGKGFRKLKRYDLALASVEKLKQTMPDVKLLVLDGTADADKIPLYINSSECVLVTSDYEGSPNIVREALACNVPVVSVDVGDVKERLDGVSPSLIADRYPDDIANAIKSIMLAKHSSNGREKSKHISQDATVAAIAAIYKATTQV